MQAFLLALALVAELQLTGATTLEEVAHQKGGTQAAAVYSTPEEDIKRITDGNTDSVFGTEGTCTLVPRMVRPWVTIDLGRAYYVSKATLWMRGFEDAAARDSNIEVRVGGSPDYTDNAVCGFKPGYFGRTDTLVCPKLLPGQYVTITRNDDVSEFLQICEAQVYAETGYISSCVCWGDPHCRSFDLAPWLHYQGSCSYIMYRDNCLDGLPNGAPSTEVIIDAKKPSATSTVSLVRAVHIKLHDYDMTISIYQGRVTTVNGVTVQGTPYHPNDKVSITTTGGYVYVTVENGVRVRYDGVYNAYVDIPRMLAEKVCGICGNADGNPNNDWMVGPSKDCMDSFPDSQPGSISSNLNEVGNSWLAYIDEDPTCPIECPEPPPPPGCTTDSHEKAKEHCEILNDPNGPFATCLNAMPADQREGYFDNCVYDSCALEIYDTLVCTYGKGLSEECAKAYGVEVVWRSDDFCPLPCPEGMTYKVCSHPCMPTCTDLNGEECGIPEEECEEGCFCKEGMVFDGEKCVSESTCGCHYAKQDVIIMVGKTFVADDCSEECTCNTAGGQLECTSMECTGLETCGSVDGQPGCVCEEPNVVKNGECKPPGCSLDQYNTEIEEGETYYAEDCSEKCTCPNGGQEATCTDTACSGLETCGVVDGNPGCVCEAPNVVEDGECQEPPPEGCTSDKYNVVIGVGEKFTSDDCSETCECEAAGADPVCTDSSCTALETCTKVDGNPTCECNEGNIIVDGICRHPSFACTLPKDRGTGTESLTRYFFHQDKCRCKELIYKGQGGNLNNFATRKECKQTCNEFEPPQECLEPYDEGACDDNIIMFYYNPETLLCKKLFYTGCGGNNNRFETKEDCRRRCKKC